MRTLFIILGGFVLLGLCALIARLAGGSGAIAWPAVAKVFIPVWFCLAALNMYVGVARAGYGFAEELPIFLVIFALPAVAAGLAWWRLG